MVSGSPIEYAPSWSVAPLVTEVAPPVSPRAALLPTTNVPALTVVEPEKVLVPESVSVPAPDFVRAPVLVAIALEIVDVPAESIAKSNVPEKPPLIVSVVLSSI